MSYGYKNIWQIAAPIMISMLLEQFIGMTDVAFLGRVGQVELGASAIAGLYYMMVFMLGVGFGVGVQIIIGRHNGEGNHAEIGLVFYQSLAVMLVFAVVGIVFTLYAAPMILQNIVSSPEVFEASIVYLKYRVWGFVFAFVIIIFRNFYVGVTDTKILSISSVAMTVVNICLNYVLIFGYWGFPKMGIGGAALASVIAEAVAAVCFVCWTIYKTDIYKYGLNRFYKINFVVIKEIFNTSIWTTMQVFISFGTWFFFFIAIEHLGEFELAASNVLRQVSSVVFLVVHSFALAANTLTANMVGQNKTSEVFVVVRKVMYLSYLACAVCLIIFGLYPEFFMGIFTNDNHIIANSVSAYYVMLSAFVIAVPALILLMVVLGLGETKQGMILEFVALFINVIYYWYTILYLRLPLAWCWSGEVVYNISLLVLCYLYLKKRYYFIDSEAK